jgi:hypothetical protein
VPGSHTRIQYQFFFSPTHLFLFLSCGATKQLWPRPPHCWGF